MKILHTADWHLGRIYHGVSLLEDQAHVLDELVALVRAERPDAVLISGDVYDRSVPPSDAVALLDDTLTRLVIGEGVPTLLIAGNHDSPERLGFGSRLLEQAGLTMRGSLDAALTPVVLRDAHGEVAFYPLPYAEPSVSRHCLADDSIADHHAALRVQLERVRSTHDESRRSVVLAHAFVTGGTASESERPLSVGGTGAVGAEVFDGIDFVALGHLHRPQAMRDGRINYSGSLLKYSFAEADHEKSVSLIEIGADGAARTRRIALRPRRDLRILTGTLAEIVSGAERDPGRDDYVLARITDTGAILDAMSKLRAAYPNALSIERPQLAGSGTGAASGADHRKISMEQLFSTFYQEMTGLELDASATELLHGEIAAQAGEEREAV
ncbi:exonuclease SbcCD subunit D [Niveibacterium sp. 24ML]|uniref:exonuclease SbcCD subunit D n=1 Tax=Niveibacterium sp. 24ML TaxID=2985512 RepID=UPI0022707D8F|nr:exonuclease SbcCD subunit D [Niveibacterium sp. 24ML]MCX9157801.1 exonuclease SbcCD subunit D [Niveibacterium sp. 24ML]